MVGRAPVHRGWGSIPAEVRPAGLLVGGASLPPSLPVPIVAGEVSPPGPPRIAWAEGEVRDSPPTDGCLESFVRLAYASPDPRVVRFAEAWGPLGICEHGMPGSHAGCPPLRAETRTWERPEAQVAWATGFAEGRADRYAMLPTEWRNTFWEPLAAWRFYARKFWAVLSLARDLKAGRAGRGDDWLYAVLEPSFFRADDSPFLTPENAFEPWEELADPAAWDPPADGRAQVVRLTKEPLADQRSRLVTAVDRLLARAGALPRLEWTRDAPRVAFTPGAPLVPRTMLSAYRWPSASLFGVLACQLAAAVTSPGDLYQCSRCGAPYPSKTKPRADRRNYCKQCSREAHREVDRLGQRRKRAAERAKRAAVDGNLDGNRSGSPPSAPVPAREKTTSIGQ